MELIPCVMGLILGLFFGVFLAFANRQTLLTTFCLELGFGVLFASILYAASSYDPFPPIFCFAGFMLNFLISLMLGSWNRQVIS